MAVICRARVRAPASNCNLLCVWDSCYVLCLDAGRNMQFNYRPRPPSEQHALLLYVAGRCDGETYPAFSATIDMWVSSVSRSVDEPCEGTVEAAGCSVVAAPTPATCRET